MQNLINRYNDIADIFPEDLRGDALPYFLDWLTEKVMRVEITAFSDDDAYTIFETMNDRGLSLTPTDMLKGYLLANITDDLMTDYGGRIKIDNLSSTHNGLVDYSAFFTVFGGEVLSAADVDELEIADRAGDSDRRKTGSGHCARPRLGSGIRDQIGLGRGSGIDFWHFE